jgi:hypothetical protein
MIGPFTTMSVSAPGVLPLCSTPYRGSAMASTSATSTGMYSGRQPAITPLIATVRTVALRRSGSSTPSSSSASRSAQRRNASTRAAVGGTIGNPSLQPFS